LNETTIQLAVAEAILGKDAEEFVSSELGRYVMGRARQQAEDAMEALKKHDPCDYRGIEKLQLKIMQAEGFGDWIKELIVAGRVAKDNLEIIRNEQEN